MASGLTALILLFPIASSTGCDGSEGPATGCTTTQESVLVRYEVSYASAAVGALGVALGIGLAIHLIGRRVSSRERRSS